MVESERQKVHLITLQVLPPLHDGSLRALYQIMTGDKGEGFRKRSTWSARLNYRFKLRNNSSTAAYQLVQPGCASGATV